MKRLLEWLKNHKQKLPLILICAIVLPPLAIHVLFSVPAPCSFLQAKWGAGDLLAYLAGLLSLSGTIILGIITVYQTKQANDLSLQLAKENNALQKISIQNQLPVVRIDNVNISRTSSSTDKNLVECGEIQCYSEIRGDDSSRKVIFTLCASKKPKFQKQIKFSITNVSDTSIKSIRFVKVEFSGFNDGKNSGDPISISGNENYNIHKMLLLPKEKIEIEIKILLDDENRYNFWEYIDYRRIGSFDMNMYIENTSISGITFYERIYIVQNADTAIRLVHDQYEESGIEKEKQ